MYVLPEDRGTPRKEFLDLPGVRSPQWGTGPPELREEFQAAPRGALGKLWICRVDFRSRFDVFLCLPALLILSWFVLCFPCFLVAAGVLRH